MPNFKINTLITPDWIQQVPSPIVLINTEFNIVSASTGWLQEFNFDQDVVINKNLFTLFPRFSKEWRNRLNYALEGLQDVKIIDHGDDPHDKKANLIWDLNPWKDGYGNIIGVILKVDRISKSKTLEIELHKTKQLLNQKGKLAKIGSWEYNVTDNNLAWTPNVNMIFGLPKDYKPTLEKVFGHYKAGYHRETIKTCVNKAINNGKPWNENLQLIKQNGDTIWVNTIGRPKYKNGKCTRVIGTIQDITDTYEKSALSHIHNSQHNPFFEKVPYGLLLVDFQTSLILDTNSSLQKITGYNNDFYKGKDLRTLCNNIKNLKFKSLIKDLKNNEKFEVITFSFYSNDKQILTLTGSGRLFLNNMNKYNLLITIEDITKATAKENSYKEQIKKSGKQIEQLLNFAHMVSHNLKSHATNFSLLLNFLNKAKEEKERNDLLKIMFTASDNLSKTIKSLREVVAIKTNINHKKTKLPLNDYIYDVEQNLLGLLKEHHGKIINEIPDNETIKAIPAYLESILTNCITNAIKYRQEDKAPIIILSVTHDNNYTVLNIEDNGLGIDMKKNGHKLFGLNKTFHSNLDARGIGLYITKYQIEAMNGKIEAESKLGIGTIFKVYFNKE